ncbi:MAG: primosomal protein N' [Alphaproteobacteria bacterium]|nr:primosomal protein N' [Alphaproteobacteria bacterium]
MTKKSAIPLKTVRVVVPAPLDGAYDYLPPEESGLLDPGAIVEVPFGRRTMLGVVWGEGNGDVPAEKLKQILRVLPLPPVPETSRSFVDWVANYTLAPTGSVLKMLFGNETLVEPKKKDAFACPVFDPDCHQPSLNEEQHAAAKILSEEPQREKPRPILLDGVTGSGKTEVFCEAIASCLRQGKQALVLLPEIAMTSALIDRFAARFGARPVEWHSGLGNRQRRLHWQAIARGEAKFILGARSALFLPYPDLGLIVVDEEHEAAYKQEEGVIYHGRDMAVVRAHLGNIPIVLSSATPSLETLSNVRQGKYGAVVLHQRFGTAEMPAIDLVDMRKYKLAAHEFIAPPLLEGLRQTLATGQQAMLFLNRRGYAPLTLCRACGHRLQCPRCTAWLTQHKQSGRLHCHHCDYTMRLPEKCPSCGAADRFAACGPGVERIAEEVKTRLPEARLSVMASDTLDTPESAQALVDSMAKKEIDILIGTQIMAKGYHFPSLTLVGVIDADLGLSGGDPRASERTFQLLQQMAGRSGRGEEAGRVFLQTVSPDHAVMKAIVKGDRDAFMNLELAEREAFRLPPFWRLASLTVSGMNVNEVTTFAQNLARSAPAGDTFRVLGPAPAPFARLRNRFRYRLMIQAPRTVNLSATLRLWLKAIKIPRTLRLAIDIDPFSFL